MLIFSRKFEGYPFVGVYRMFTPCLLIREPNMIKHITIDDFKHFQDNDIYVDKNINKIVSKNTFVVKGSEWKTCKAKIAPCLSSSKVRQVTTSSSLNTHVF